MKKKGLKDILKNKKALSTIIVTLILILISLVAIGVFWVVIQNLIQGNTENIGLEKLTLSTEIKGVNIDNSSNNVTLAIKRNVGEGEIVGMKFVFYNGSSTEIIREDFELEELVERKFVLHLAMNVTSLMKISIVPLFRSTDGKENVGNVADTYDVKTGKRIEAITEPPAINSTCTPTTNPCGSAVCGTAINGSCGNVSCGTLNGNCQSGYNCIGGTCVMQTGNIFEDYFESGDLSNWALGGSPEIGLIHRSGEFSAKINVTSGGTEYLYRAITTGTNHYRICFYLDNDFTLNTGASVGLIRLELPTGGGSQNERISLINQGGVFYLTSFNAGMGVTPIFKETWNCIEEQYDAGNILIWLNDNLELSAVDSTPDNIGRFVAGYRVNSGAIGTTYLDDIKLSNSFIGSGPEIKLYYPDSFARTEHRIFAVFSGNNPSDKLVLTLNGNLVYEKTNPLGSEIIKVDIASLSASTSNLIEARLLTSSDVEITSASFSFEKYVNGMSTVAIDGDNNILIEGQKIFPVLPCVVNQANIGNWISHGWVNQWGWMAGFNSQYTRETYESYLGEVALNGVRAIGPGCRHRNGVCAQDSTLHISLPDIADYVNYLKNHPGVFMWFWADEADVNSQMTPATMESWKDTCHSIDPNHPVAANMYGWAPQIAKDKGYYYPTLVADVYSFDVYPIQYGRTFAFYADTIDIFKKLNLDLTPWFSYVEVADTDVEDEFPGPTPSQIRMEAWINIVHGIKGISWWHPWGTISQENWDMMAQVTSEITSLSNAILLSPTQRTLSDNSNVQGNRVDTMIKENNSDIYIFTVRLTESLAGYVEPTSISTTFNVGGGNLGTIVNVINESRTLTLSGGQFTDTFNQEAVHVYRIQKVN